MVHCYNSQKNEKNKNKNKHWKEKWRRIGSYEEKDEEERKKNLR